MAHAIIRRTEDTVATVEADDDGDVTLTVTGTHSIDRGVSYKASSTVRRTLSTDEARELAAHLLAAAHEADTYTAEQAAQ